MLLKNLDQILIDEKGDEYTDKTTVRKVLRIAASQNANVQALGISETWQQRDQLGALVVKLGRAQKRVQLSSEEIALLKPRIGLIFDPLTVNRVFDILEERTPTEKKMADEIDPPEPAAAA